MTFDVFDVVVTHFPFADRNAEKRRSAVILSPLAEFGSATGVAMIAMTRPGGSQWPFDVTVGDLAAAGLKARLRRQDETGDSRFQTHRAQAWSAGA